MFQQEPGFSWTGFNLSAEDFSSSSNISTAILLPANFYDSESTIWELGRTTTFKMIHLNGVV